MDKNGFFSATLGGFIVGTMAGIHGAAKTGSDLIQSAGILGSGMGLFMGAKKLSGLGEQGTNKNTLETLATGLALSEFAGAIIGYAGYKLLSNTPTLAMNEFALTVLASYPFSLGALYCIQFYMDYAERENAAEKNKEATQEILTRHPAWR